MAVIAIINRKGGSGKSTLATHIAGYLASRGDEVMLGDVDRQQSSSMWLALRPRDRPKIHGWNHDARNFARPPAGTKHVVLDTPAGFQGLGLMKVALYADAILVPTTSSLFDRDAAAEGIKELRTLPRVSAAKCQIACVGLRIDARTRNGDVLEGWAEKLGVPYLGAIRQLQLYQRCVEQGLSLFDFPREKFSPYLQEWAKTTAWVDDLLSRPQPESRDLVRVTHRTLPEAEPAIGAGPTGTHGGDTPRPAVTPSLAEGIPTFLRKLMPQLYK